MSTSELDVFDEVYPAHSEVPLQPNNGSKFNCLQSFEILTSQVAADHALNFGCHSIINLLMVSILDLVNEISFISDGKMVVGPQLSG